MYRATNTYPPFDLEQVSELSNERSQIHSGLFLILFVLQCFFVEPSNDLVAQVTCENPDRLVTVDLSICASILVFTCRVNQSAIQE
jgi:hypothetical protein